MDQQNEQKQSAKFGADVPEKKEGDAADKIEQDERIQAMQYEENEYLVKYQQYLKKRPRKSESKEASQVSPS